MREVEALCGRVCFEGAIRASSLAAARLRWCRTRRVQVEPRPYEFWEGIKSHLANPGGIVMMVAYLCASWMFDVMPCSYYSFEGGVRWWMVFAQVANSPSPEKLGPLAMAPGCRWAWVTSILRVRLDAEARC